MTRALPRVTNSCEGIENEVMQDDTQGKNRRRHRHPEDAR